MKRLILIFLTALAGISSGQNQSKVSERTLLEAADISTSADWIAISDMSAAEAQRSKKTNIDEMWKKLGGTNVSATELGYLDGVTSSIQPQITAKQATLVSGTNLKSINGTSLLGPGDLTVSGGTWGSITGTLSSQTDLVAALAAKVGTAGAIRVTFADGTRTDYAPSANTDTARGVAFETAWAACLASTGFETIDLYPANFYIAKSTSSIAAITAQFAIEDGMTVNFNGARLYKKSTDTASAMFAANGANGIDRFSFIGPGMIEGSYAANADTAARGSAASEHGIHVRMCRIVNIHRLAIRNFAGTGVLGNSGSFATDEYSGGGSTKISTVHITDCNIDLNNVGLNANQSNEYWNIMGCTLNKNVQAVDNYYAGNMRIVGGEVTNNTNGLLVRHNAGANSGHGICEGVMFNHNTGYSVQVASGLTNGYSFTGCHFFADSSTTNKIEVLGTNVVFSGCLIDSPFYAGSTPTGLNLVTGSMFIQNSVSAAQAVADLSSAERLQWVFDDSNMTSAGGYANNDTIIYRFTDDTAAGSGGMTAGRKYTDSDTNGVCIKQ